MRPIPSPPTLTLWNFFQPESEVLAGQTGTFRSLTFIFTLSLPDPSPSPEGRHVDYDDILFWRDQGTTAPFSAPFIVIAQTPRHSQ